MSLFNYNTFVRELRLNPQKKEAVVNYEKLVGPVGIRPLINSRDVNGNEVKNSGEVWYNKLVRPFEGIDTYAVPKELKQDFDWKLLTQLGASSLSSTLYLEYREKVLELRIDVNSNGQCVSKYVTKLWGFQVLRLFEIWCEENINLCALCYEDGNEKNAIFQQKMKKLKHWHEQLSRVNHLV